MHRYCMKFSHKYAQGGCILIPKLKSMYWRRCVILRPSPVSDKFLLDDSNIYGAFLEDYVKFRISMVWWCVQGCGSYTLSSTASAKDVSLSYPRMSSISSNCREVPLVAHNCGDNTYIMFPPLDTQMIWLMIFHPPIPLIGILLSRFRAFFGAPGLGTNHRIVRRN